MSEAGSAGGTLSGARPSRSLAAAGMVLLCLVCIGVFGRVVGHDLLEWDDRYHLVDNPGFAQMNGDTFAQFWRAPYGNLYIPVAYNFFAVEVGLTQAISGESRLAHIDPLLLHAMKIALHAANAGMVFLLIRRVVRWTGAALIGALLFAVHPLQVESVAWISETRGLLAGMFGLAATLALWRAVETRWAAAVKDGERAPALHAAIPARVVWYVFGLAMLAGALLSKPSAVTIPVVAAAILWAGGVPARRIALAIIPWLVMAGAAVVITQNVQSAEVMGQAPAVWQRPLIAADALCFYVGKLVWPIDLAPDYGRTPANVLTGWWPWAALAMVIAVGGLAAWMARRSPVAVAAAVVAVGSLLPVLGLATFHHQAISTVADRYMYIAMLGPALLLAAWLTRVHSRIAWATVVCAMAGLGVLSFVQSAHWENDETLWRHNLAANPTSPVALNNLGRELQRQNRHAEAEPLLVRALEIDGDSATVLVNLAELRMVQGRAAEAEAMYRRALEIAPRSSRAAIGLGIVLAQSGRDPEAAEMFERALEAEPDQPEAMNNLGLIRLRQGQMEVAGRLLERVLVRRPEHIEALYNLGIVRAQSGRWMNAAMLWRQAAAAGMAGAEVRMRAADAFARANAFEEAERAYEDAAAADPGAYEPHNNLGLLLVKQQRYFEAAMAFERAVQIAPDAPEPAENLRNARRLIGR